mgnify:FL=1|tara:strand:- start:4938 stop:5171 length:234 start_codon:yes stop_codon:yes gene_type:complete
MRTLLLASLLACFASTDLRAQDAVDPVDSFEFDPAPTVPKIGEPIPNLVLPTIDGKQTIALSQYKGQKVLLIVFASW